MKKWLALLLCTVLLCAPAAAASENKDADGVEVLTTSMTETSDETVSAASTEAAAADETAAAASTEAAPADETAAAAAETAAADETAAAAATEAAADETKKDSIPYWTADSPAMASIIEFVDSVTDETSPDYVPPAERIAAFDSDGTLVGELLPTYFDQCLLMHRLLHDENYEAAPEDKEFAQALETALLNEEPEPDSPRSTAQMMAESFKGHTVEEYRDYIHDFMSEPVIGFDGMTYGEIFYEPMKALVQYLAENDFKVFICSGTERNILRELTEGTLDQWIPPYQVIGSTFSLIATGQGDKTPRNYTYTADDRVLLEGNMIFKNLKMNKVVSIVDEIGASPILVFGNSSGDLAMAQYAAQHGGKAYMLLCDDTERDYGNLQVAEFFKEECEILGFETVSMKNEFATIYGDDVVKTERKASETSETGASQTDSADAATKEEAAQAGATEAPAADTASTKDEAAQAGVTEAPVADTASTKDEAAQAGVTEAPAADTASTKDEAAETGMTQTDTEEDTEENTDDEALKPAA